MCVALKIMLTIVRLFNEMAPWLIFFLLKLICLLDVYLMTLCPLPLQIVLRFPSNKYGVSCGACDKGVPQLGRSRVIRVFRGGAGPR